MPFRLIIPALLMLALIGCKTEYTCYYNCPDEASRICGEEDMSSGDDDECRLLAEQKCEENPEHLEDWDGGVVYQVIGCEGNDPCGLPNWCLP